jgi:ribosomal protein L11 methyltransferase
MSFGTGEHETTKMMIRAIEKHVSKGDFVLDAGAGTAILAIAALKLGASKAIAFDNDEWCKINGDENKNLNQISEELEIILGEIADVQQTNFDLILANINTHILIEIKKQLAEKLKFGGKMILSGLLNADNSLITEHFQSEKLQKIDEDSENEWSLLVFQKE